MTEPLTTAGARRRDAMLDVLHGAMKQRLRRRTAMRTAAIALLLVGAGAVAVMLRPHSAPTAPAPALVSAPSMHHASSSVVSTATTPSVATFRPIDDDELLAELRALGHPTGLIRTQNRVTLTADLKLREDPGGAG